jgi:hypothetical protein
MKEIDLSLNNDEFESLRELSTADAAVELCQTYFRRHNSRVAFPKSPNGADLCVRFPTDPAFDIEVKGTEESGIAWNQLKVSGQPSYDLLKNGMPLYRVSGVGSRNVKIFVLNYGEDFEMTPEPRWRVHPIKKGLHKLDSPFG